MSKHGQLIPVSTIAQRILFLRGQKVMIDADLAELYGVETKALNQAVKRNIERFPPEFMFQLTKTEKNEVVTFCDHLNRLRFSPSLPYAFTEHGALMLGNVLKSPRAIEVSLLVVKTFVRLREMLASHKDLELKLNELEQKFAEHDEAIVQLVEAIRQLMRHPESANRSIGFTADLSSNEDDI